MRMPRFCCILVLPALCCGCLPFTQGGTFGRIAMMSASGSVFKADKVVPPGQARLILYRLPSGLHGQHYELIRINGEDATTIVNGGYWDCFVPAGKVTITRSPRMAGAVLQRSEFGWPIELEMESGDTRFVRFYGKPVSWNPVLQTEIVPGPKALDDLKGRRQFEPEHLKMGL